ncbi:MAG: hypothetical protein ACP5IA_08295 [Sediminispirochaetaceae bacterium]
MRRGVPFFILIFSIVLCTGVLGEAIFAPFVSSLSASTEQNRVTLTWKKAPAELYGYSIYRSNTPFSTATFSNAVRVGAVSEAETSFTDTPPDTRGYYYAVLGRDEDGSLYPLFIPYRNILMQPVSVSTTLTPDQIVTQVTNLRAYAEENSIELSFSSSRPNRPVIVYRSTSPINESSDLIPATAVTTLGSNENSFVDFPLPGVPYYYAVFDAGATKSGQYTFIPGENTLQEPVEIGLRGTSAFLPRGDESKRITPLPFLLLNSGILSGNQISRDLNYTRVTQELDDETLSVWQSIDSRLAFSGQDTSAFSPVLLGIDTSRDLTGEDYQLSLIVASSFSTTEPDTVDWGMIEKQLASFMSVRHSAKATDRGHFYLGQVYYYQGKYSQSFFEFLMARDSYFVETQPWIDRLFELLTL